MVYQMKDLKRAHDAEPCGGTIVNGTSVCSTPTDIYEQSEPPQELQWKYRPDREALPTSLWAEGLSHQFGFCINIILVVLISYYLFPELRGRMGGFFMLSYPSDDLYGIGPQDLKLVLGCVVFFTAARAAILDHVSGPLAAKLGVIKTETRTRFAEQSYIIVYYTLFWSWGLLIFAGMTQNESKGIDGLLISLWDGFPRLRLKGSLKLYYLSQFAFWLQQVAVLHLERRRKDHFQMLLHHVVTILLLAGSYSYRQWRVGNAVLVCMDLVDIILPVAKVLRYLSLQRSCNATFAVFVAAWVVTRHVFLLAICWSIHNHVHNETMVYGSYSTVTGALISAEHNSDILSNIFQPFVRPSSESIAFNANIRWMFFGLLLLLQCIIIAWFVMILRVIGRMLRGKGATDARSGDEED